MDLLQENKKKPQKTQAQKTVLILLIISIILCVIVAGAMLYLDLKGENKPFSIAINGKNININELQIINNSNNEKYISLKTIANKLNYRYLNGEFRIPGEGENKGYIDNQKNIIQFSADSNEIYKTTEDSNTDYEYYKLEKPILEYEGNLYIFINDLDNALNLILNYSEVNNKITIETPENWILGKEEAFKSKDTLISTEPENLRAMAYGYLVINKDNKYGVINLINGEEIIGNKYSSIKFCEYTKNFIVSNTNNKFGVITKAGLADIDLQYDKLEIINYSPLLYKVERLEKYGVIKEDGSVINSIKYDSIAYPENKSKEINYTLIVPNLNENIPESIVVCSNDKYGLVDIETGKEIIPCIVPGIYSKEDDPDKYFVEGPNENIYSIESFVENLNRVTATID